MPFTFSRHSLGTFIEPTDPNELQQGVEIVSKGVYNVCEAVDSAQASDYARGDGVTDDSGAFALADTNNAGNGVTYAPPSASRYLFSVSKTLNHALRLAPSAILKPSSGQTITIAGPLDAGAYQIFDLSAGGAIALGARIKILPEWLGADPTGATDSTAALNAAFTAAQAQAVGGCVELAPNATYKHNAALTLGSGVIELYGHGNSSVIQATAAMTAQILGTDTSFSTLHDFTLDGGNHACDGLHFKTSAGPGNDLTTSCKWSRIVTINHPSGNWPLYNQGHEDLTIADCITRESVNGLYSHTPNGAIRVANCSIFGYWDIDYQLFSVDNCVTGPFLQTPNGYSLLEVAKSYCYDSPTYHMVHGNGGNPSSATFTGCYFPVTQALVNTGLNNDTIIKFEDCSVIYIGAAAPYNILDCGNTGNNSKFILKNVTCQANAATSVKAVNVAGGTSPWVAIDPAISGATAGITTYLNPAVVPASGTAATNGYPGPVWFVTSGGTVTGIAVDGQATGLTSGALRVRSGSTITWTYSAVPTVQMFQAE